MAVRGGFAVRRRRRRCGSSSPGRAAARDGRPPPNRRRRRRPRDGACRRPKSALAHVLRAPPGRRRRARVFRVRQTPARVLRARALPRARGAPADRPEVHAERPVERREGRADQQEAAARQEGRQGDQELVEQPAAGGADAAVCRCAAAQTRRTARRGSRASAPGRARRRGPPGRRARRGRTTRGSSTRRAGPSRTPRESCRRGVELGEVRRERFARARRRDTPGENDGTMMTRRARVTVYPRRAIEKRFLSFSFTAHRGCRPRCPNP